MGDQTGDVTLLLRRWTDGDEGLAGVLFERLYGELRAIAGAQMSRESVGQTLQPTALVHEAFLRFHRAGRIELNDRVHFLGVAARIMRQILVDRARHRAVANRHLRESFQVDAPAVGETRDPVDLLSLDHALDRLATLDEQQARVVELRYFGGLGIDETAALLGTSTSTVNRAWRAASTWLYQQLRDAP